MKAVCHWCGKEFETKKGYYNRAKQMGNNVYCSRKHSGFGRRSGRTKEEDKFIKYFYDAFIGLVDFEKRKKQRKEWFDKDYAANPEKYRARRKKKMKAHIEYCRQPEYRAKKKIYDRQRVAKNNYGEYWEAAISLHQLADIVDNRRAKREQTIFNKSQKRKRNAKNIKRQELEKCSMGLYQPS